MTQNYTALGRKGFWYYVRLIVRAPIWYLYPNPERVPWPQFKGSLIKHKCQFDPNRIVARWRSGTIYRFRPPKPLTRRNARRQLVPSCGTQSAGRAENGI